MIWMARLDWKVEKEIIETEIQRLDIEELKEFLFALGQGREKAYGNILEVRSIMDATSFEVGV